MLWIAAAVSRKSRVPTMANLWGSSRCSISRTALPAASKDTVRKWRDLPRTVTFMGKVSGAAGRVSRIEGRARSGDLNAHLADLVFDGSVTGMFAQLAQVRIFGQPFEITIAEREGLL